MIDCLIVGGGIIGMLTANELHTAGMAVALVEKGSPGRESSWAGGGIISPLYPWRYDDSISKLAQWS
ncbi:MAG: FAD-binding oxidoreductase, partial [Candidatus Thiodiazotropha endolucinida]|nr:FAD-binding oxidoreductase [Candidatus Thiodiazotropha taylori]MCW4239053.1 FAD-binding oxidoreductase [Candidatus Thiodiazotropha endolucinida]